MSDVVSFEHLSKDEICSFVQGAEDSIKQAINIDPSVEVKFPVTNRFSKGVYAREIFIPKGTYIVGKIHKYENLNILSKGDISIVSIDGTIRVQAPYTVVSSPGVKRLAYAHEDSVWTTIHGTEETDIDKIEELFIAKTYADVPALQGEVKKLQGGYMSWAMVGGTVVGGVMGKLKNDEAQKRQQQSANAAADATAVSWGRHNGVGQIPQVQYNQGSQTGDILSGGVSGGMFGQKLGAMDWSKAAQNPYDQASSGGVLGMGQSYNPDMVSKMSKIGR